VDEAHARYKFVVWDLPIRLFHWALVLLLVTSYVTAKLDELELHMLSGYAVLALLLFRLAWGLVGSDTARFSHFMRGPRAVFFYLRGGWVVQPGHNPAGGWSVAAMLILLCAQVGTGLFANDDIITQGPLAQFVEHDTSRTLTGLHHLIVNFLLAFVALHVGAIGYYRFARHQDLMTPMVRGWAIATDAAKPPRVRSLWLAGGLFVAATSVAWAVARLEG